MCYFNNFPWLIELKIDIISWVLKLNGIYITKFLYQRKDQWYYAFGM